MALNWTNRVNNVDDVDAADVNALAGAIKDNETAIAANTAARHTHDNKSILDQVTQETIDGDSTATIITVDTSDDWDSLDTDETMFGVLDVSPNWDLLSPANGDFRNGYIAEPTTDDRTEVFFYSSVYNPDNQGVKEIVQYFIRSNGDMFARNVHKSQSTYTYGEFTNFEKITDFFLTGSTPPDSTIEAQMGAIYYDYGDNKFYIDGFSSWENIVTAEKYFRTVSSMPPSTASPVGGIVIDTSGATPALWVCTAYDSQNGSSYKKVIGSTDYASGNDAGIIRASSTYGTGVNNDNGIIYGTTKTYSQYSSGNEQMLISKGTLENVIGSTGAKLKPTVTTGLPLAGSYTLTMNAYDNYDVRIDSLNTESLTSLTLYFAEDEYATDYSMSFNFNSGSTPTDIVYVIMPTNPVHSIINWVGEDCTMSGTISLFTPQANKHYEVIVYYNGYTFVGEVAGYVTATGNVVSS